MLQDNLVYFLPSPRIRPSSISLIVLGFFNWRRVLETKTQVHSVLIAPGVSLPSRLSQLTKQDNMFMYTILCAYVRMCVCLLVP